jgi:hypothetical protein
MPGYLDQYGAGEEQRNRIIIRSVAAVLIVAVSGLLGWYLLKNHHQESVVKTFVDALRRGDYQAAYRDWGCTPERPCPAYPFTSFMRDWGPASTANGAGGNGAASGGSAADFGITDSESCNTGVLLTVNAGGGSTEKLWVDKGDDAINFAPYPICPHKSPFAIMIHRTIGRLRKPLLR